MNTIGDAWDNFVSSAKKSLGLIVDDLLPETTENTDEERTVETPKEAEWVWVTGYKGMNKDMQCRGGFQYELGRRYDMPEDAKVEACESGFHLCLALGDVFKYVPVGDNNRFFQVRALVRKRDRDEYGGMQYYEDGLGRRHQLGLIDKLAAKSIEIVRELTADEILKPYGGDEWDEGYKKLALSASVDVARMTMRIDNLTELGYSFPFATWLVNNKKYEVAKAVGSQPDLSMDMKCLMIMNG